MDKWFLIYDDPYAKVNYAKAKEKIVTLKN